MFQRQRVVKWTGTQVKVESEVIMFFKTNAFHNRAGVHTSLSQEDEDDSPCRIGGEEQRHFCIAGTGTPQSPIAAAANHPSLRRTAFGLPSKHQFDKKSGRQDLNLRPSGPKPDALAKLSYAPGEMTVPRCFQGVNGETPAEDGGFTPGLPDSGREERPSGKCSDRWELAGIKSPRPGLVTPKSLRKIRANQPNGNKGLDGPK